MTGTHHRTRPAETKRADRAGVKKTVALETSFGGIVPRGNKTAAPGKAVTHAKRTCADRAGEGPPRGNKTAAPEPAARR